MNINSFFESVAPTRINSTAIDWVLIKREPDCDRLEVGVMKYQRSASHADGHCFRCNKCRKRISYRHGSFFSGSKLALKELMTILFFFVIEQPVTSCATLSGVSEKTCIDWYNYFRDICMAAQKVLVENEKVGGRNIVVQIDESLIAKRKYERGRPARNIWVFGVYCPDTHLAFVREVARRNRPAS